MPIAKKANRKKKYSIEEIFYKIQLLENKCNRITYLLGYKSSEISKSFRNIITMCNSVAIVFLQFDLVKEALVVLRKGIEMDISMFVEGEFDDRKWFGRPLLYCNLGFLLERVGDHSGSLKFLYDAESILFESKHLADSDPNLGDVTLGHACLTFLVLCRIDRLDHAQKYLEVATAQINQIIEQERSSRLKKSNCITLYCLMTLAINVVKSILNREDRIRVDEARTALKKFEDSTPASQLLKRLLRVQSHSEALHILLSEEFRGILYVTTFFPFIAPNTPVLSMQSINYAQRNSQEYEAPNFVLQNLQGVKPHFHENYDNYSLLMKEALSKLKDSF